MQLKNPNGMYNVRLKNQLLFHGVSVEACDIIQDAGFHTLEEMSQLFEKSKESIEEDLHKLEVNL